MCSFLYGGVNKETNKSDLEKIKNNIYKFSSVTQSKLTKALEEENWEYRITNEYCDCGTLAEQKTAGNGIVF